MLCIPAHLPLYDLYMTYDKSEADNKLCAVCLLLTGHGQTEILRRALYAVWYFYSSRYSRFDLLLASDLFSYFCITLQHYFLVQLMFFVVILFYFLMFPAILIAAAVWPHRSHKVNIGIFITKFARHKCTLEGLPPIQTFFNLC